MTTACPFTRTFATLVVAGLGLVPAVASASVTGSQGVEIEGARDRRGFFIGPEVGFAGTFIGPELLPSAKLGVSLGGGVSKRLTLGVNAYFSPYFKSGGYLGFGGDIEVTGFVYQGLFLRGGVGGGAVPQDIDDSSLAGSMGGKLGVGYEFFLNQTAAMSIALEYDGRAVPVDGGTTFRNGVLAGFRFTWY